MEIRDGGTGPKETRHCFDKDPPLGTNLGTTGKKRGSKGNMGVQANGTEIRDTWRGGKNFTGLNRAPSNKQNCRVRSGPGERKKDPPK